jgi:hypothetical protein
MNFPKDQISIYSGTEINKDFRKALQAMFPSSCKKASDLVISTERFGKRKGFFSSDEKRYFKVYTDIVVLGYAFKKDVSEHIIQFPLEQQLEIAALNTKKEHVIYFLNLFSLAFPNWQQEYSTLNMIIKDIEIEDV